jgi:DNA (cytosine-5)-methyltransferase 1
MTDAAYYNEIDPKAAKWLRELIKAGHIADGDVDTRSIADVKASELAGYTQCHFFAGIGIWSAAFRLAGIPDTRPVWSGSCPCQEYSVAGKGKGASGDKDLWPIFASLIAECRPTAVYGEQVAAAIGYGWLDRVRTDLEAENYAVGGVVLGAHSAGAPHIRQRLWWVGHASNDGYSRLRKQENRSRDQGWPSPHQPELNGTGELIGLADVCGAGLHRRERDGAPVSERQSVGHARKRGRDGGLADVQRDGSETRIPRQDTRKEGIARVSDDSGGQQYDLWRDSQWHNCRDGNQRRIPTEPRLFPLAHARDSKGYRVAALRGAGNAINLGTAAMFIESTMTDQTEQA